MSQATSTSAAEPVVHEWQRELAARAAELYEQFEWPTPQEEEWRRTDVTQFPFDEYRDYTHSDDVVLPGVERGSGVRLEFNAGVCTSISISESVSRAGVQIAPLSSDVTVSDEALDAMTEAVLEGIDNRIQAWHFSREMHGAFVRVPAGVKIEEPILVEFVERGPSVAANPQVFLILEDGAEATLIEIVRTQGEDKLVCNSGFDAVVGQNARLNIVSILDVGDSATVFEHRNIRIARDGTVQHFSGHFGGALVKSRLEASLDGEGSEAMLSGAYLGDRSQHTDIRTVQTHRAPHTSSRSLYKGAVKGSARTVYQGMIEVEETAVQTDAYLTNNNLILNDGARADSIPSLKIRTNDVKCSHGSTTGRIDEEQLFYLMSRGYPADEARTALVEAYFEDVVRAAGDQSRELFMEIARRRLSGR